MKLSTRARVGAITKGVAGHAKWTFYPCIWAMLMLGMSGPDVAQDDGGQQPTAREQLQQADPYAAIDQEFAHLTKDLELTPKQQQQQVRPLLQEHHDKIQALLDMNPNASRQELAPQTHAISDETHREIHALLTDHQKELEKATREREHSVQKTSGPLRLRLRRHSHLLRPARSKSLTLATRDLRRL
jgi:hypothetical protein